MIKYYFQFAVGKEWEKIINRKIAKKNVSLKDFSQEMLLQSSKGTRLSIVKSVCKEDFSIEFTQTQNLPHPLHSNSIIHT